MPKYRHRLPQLSGGLFLTDGGLETSLIFHDGIDLPLFASFDLLKGAKGTAAIRAYYERYIAIAKRNNTGFVLEGATWRASPDWGEKLGYSRAQLAEANRAAVKLMAELRSKHETTQTPMVISANIGPRGDGYKIDKAMTAAEAEDYHGWQVCVFRDTEADLISAFTINYADEGIGIVRACQRAGMPSVISFTVETDGKLPSGRRSATRSSRPIVRPATHRPITCSIARIPRISPMSCAKAKPGLRACAACGQMLRRAAMLSSIPRPISTPAIRAISASAIARCAGSSGTSRCSAAVAAPITGMSSRFRSRACRLEFMSASEGDAWRACLGAILQVTQNRDAE
jgi:Homocysteine S-methyltransferase